MNDMERLNVRGFFKIFFGSYEREAMQTKQHSYTFCHVKINRLAQALR